MRRNTCMLTLKVQCQNLTSGHSHVVSLRPEVMVHMNQCVYTKEIHWNHPHYFALFYKKIRRKHRIWSHITLKNQKEGSLGQNSIWFIESGLMRKLWDTKHAPTRTFGINGIWKFSHYLMMVNSQNWLDPRIPKLKFLDICFVCVECWYPDQLQKIDSKWFIKNCSHGATKKIFGDRVTTWPEMTSDWNV